MINITIDRNQKKYTGFHCIGHAEYAKPGEDIICAAVSVLVINTINSIETLVGDAFEFMSEEESGRIDFSLRKDFSPESELLLQSMVLGLQGIQNNYGNEYIRMIFKEV